MLPTPHVSLEAEEVRAVALGEMARKRRHLGRLTPEQERALQSLLVTVADNIFSLVSGATAARAGGGGGERGGEAL